MLRFTASYSNACNQAQPLSFVSDPRDSVGLQKFSSLGMGSHDDTRLSLAVEPPHPLVNKLRRFVALNDGEVDALSWATKQSRNVCAEHVLFHEDSRPDHVCLITRGLAYSYKMLAGGRRQILGYLMPGDLCDMNFIVFNQPDHSLALLTNSEVVKIPLRTISELSTRYPRIDRALTLAALVDRAILREWLLSVGQRDALQRLGHFFCEMYFRAKAVDLIARDGSIDFPINQYALADTIGLTPVHVNRTLQRLRREKMIALCQRRLTILDYEQLAERSGFDGKYMQAHFMQD